MEIRKEAQAGVGGAPSAMQLEKINALAKARLNGEQVYVFSLRLCDDQMDRDFERFDTQALPELARMFLGKTGIVDHQWSTEKQVARIFETQVVQDGSVSYIKAWAYIRRGGANEETIADIEAGIKKEVSVGCAMGQAVCSICGGEYGTCGHGKGQSYDGQVCCAILRQPVGQSYDGQVCCAILRQPVDAYEFSFVAVPAQREAGVLKAMGAGQKRLKELAEQFGAQGEYQALKQQAALGQRYRKELEDSVVRLGLSLELGLQEPVLRRLAQCAGAEDLTAVKAAWQERLEQLMPVVTQLGGQLERSAEVESGFLI